MYKVKDAVKLILFQSEVALTAFHENYLNFSSYAKKIKKEVEKETKKPVSAGNILVSLSRLKQEFKGEKYSADSNLFPKIFLDDIIVKSNLTELTYENTIENRSVLSALQKKSQITIENINMLSLGINEITIVLPTKLKEKSIALFTNSKPKIIIDKLASITVRFSEKYLYVPNTLYMIFRGLALKQINVIEVVSTFTELSLIITQKELTRTFEILNAMIKT